MFTYAIEYQTYPYRILNNLSKIDSRQSRDRLGQG